MKLRSSRIVIINNSNNMKTTFIRTCGSSLRKYYSNAWEVKNISLLHEDIIKINTLKYENEQVPFVIEEIPPPYCQKCHSFIQNKCNYPFLNLDNPNVELDSYRILSVKCPIFGTVKGFIG